MTLAGLFRTLRNYYDRAMIGAGLRRAPSIARCTFPWKWLIVTEHGHVMPCCFTDEPIGNLREQTVEEIWNGKAMARLRRRIKRGRVHPLCAKAGCAFLTPRPGEDDAALGNATARLTVEEAGSFDNAVYLSTYPDVASAIERGLLADGLEHYVQFGRAEGRQFPTRNDNRRNEISLTARALLSFTQGQFVVSHAPTQVVVGVTTQCNLKCVMCPHGTGAIGEGKHLPEHLLDKLLPYIRKTQWIELVGIGEPMLAPAFWTVLADEQLLPQTYIRSNCNGYLLVQPYIDRLIRSPLREISVSFDAATAQTYRRIRGGDLRRVVRNVKALTARRHELGGARLKIHVNMTLMRANIAEVAGLVALAKECGADAVYLSRLARFPTTDQWRVERGDWVFDYAEEMLDSRAETAREHIRAGFEAAAVLGIPLFLQNGAEAWQ